MGRQRTINDSNFWRSPLIAGKTQEDKATLLYLLTSPFSNIVGAYPIVPRIAAAEMGWTSEQLLLVIDRLAEFDLVAYDEQSCNVWVKIWWEHNSAKMAVGPSLRSNTYAQIDQIIPSWRNAYIVDFVSRLPTKDGLRDAIHAQLAEGVCTVTTPCPEAPVRAAANTTYNSNPINNNNDAVQAAEAEDVLEFPNLSDAEIRGLRPLISALPFQLQQEVLDEIEGKRRNGRLKTSAAALCSYFQKRPGAFVLSDGVEVKAERARRQAQREKDDALFRREAAFTAAVDQSLASMSDEELLRQNALLPARLAEKTVARRKLLMSLLDAPKL